MRLNIQRFAEWDEIINNFNTSLNNAQTQLSGLDAEKQKLLDDYTTNYNDQLAKYDNLINQQQTNIDTWAEKQKEIQQNQTDYNIGLINQNKEQAQKQTDAELGDAYIDYQKGMNQFGGNAEIMASSGLAGTGFSKNAEIAMNITYQNRVSTANAALMKANTEYSNQIEQARLNNDAALAEIALQQMTQSYQLALQGFEYKNNLYNNKLAYEMDLSDTYFNRKQSLQDDINYYNQQLAEINQYQEEQARWEREFAQQQKEHQDSMTKFWADFNESKRQFDLQYGGYDDDEEETETTSDNILKNQTATTPVLSSRYAQNWADKNIYTANVIKNGISETDLMNKLNTALKAGTINQNDVDKILKGFGYSTGSNTTTTSSQPKTIIERQMDNFNKMRTGGLSV